MQWPTREQILYLHHSLIVRFGGTHGLRDSAALDSALAQPKQSFDGVDLYQDLIAKAAALGFFLISNHPFVDGNKRTGHAALEVTLLLNGWEIQAMVEEQERVILAVAAGEMDRDTFTAWLRWVVISKQFIGG